MTHSKPFIVGEIGNNSEGNIKIAKKMICIARNCGADAVKFQVGTAEGFARRKRDRDKYRKSTIKMGGK